METPPTFSSQQTPPTEDPPAFRVRLAAIGIAWRIIWQDVWPWVILMFLLVVASSAVQVPIQFALQMSMMPVAGSRVQSASDPFQGMNLTPGMVLGLAFLGIAVIGIQGFINTLPQRFTPRKLRGMPATINDMFSFDGAFPRVAVWWLVYPLLMGIVPVALMVPAFVAAGGVSLHPENAFYSPVFWGAYGISIAWFLAAQAMFAFVPLLIVDQGLSVLEAVQLSVKTLARHVLPMLGVVYICAAFLGSLGVCACYVGMFVTGCLQQATLGVVYNDFFRKVDPVLEQSAYPRPQW